uniref:Uncharacterized protein n=2 Tax=Magallana gigas TaxID=29159 RepID=A0A8W8INR5_MAGGI
MATTKSNAVLFTTIIYVVYTIGPIASQKSFRYDENLYQDQDETLVEKRQFDRLASGL